MVVAVLASAAVLGSLLANQYLRPRPGPNRRPAKWKADRRAGVNLRHYTNWHWQDTSPVSRNDLRVGDVVFYYRDLHHLGLHVGDGWLVHAPASGDVVA